MSDAGPPATERLAFRRWVDGDAPTVRDIYSRPEVSRFLGAVPEPVTDLVQARARIRSWNQRTTGVAGIWAMTRRDRHGAPIEPPIGTVLVVPLPRSDGAPSDVYEIGWHVHPQWWGRGYATEAAAAAIERAREAGLTELRAVVNPGNDASRAVCSRLGMAEAGPTGEWHGVELIEYRLDLAAPDSPDVLAVRIAQARAERRLLPAPVGHGLTPGDAYYVQERVLAGRMAAGGGRAGWKLGYTSPAMREQMGVAEPNYGPLARGMLLPDGSVIGDGVTQPRVEPEIAAVLGSDVDPDTATRDLGDAVAEWRLALEVVDSVWEEYRFDWALNTADGSSAAFVVLGDAMAGDDLTTAEVSLIRNGETVGRGAGSAAMGDPHSALAWLVERLAARHAVLRAGDVVITGGLTAAVPLSRGDRFEAVSGGSKARLTRRP